MYCIASLSQVLVIYFDSHSPQTRDKIAILLMFSLHAILLELHKGDMMPSDAEFSSLDIFVKVMKPLVDITEDIGAEKWVTISVVQLIVHKII